MFIELHEGKKCMLVEFRANTRDMWHHVTPYIMECAYQGSVPCVGREYTQGKTMMQILTMCFVNMSPFVYDMKKGDCLIYMKIEKSDRE